MVEATEGTVAVDGAELYYTVEGSGPTCLVLTAVGTEPYRQMTPPQLAERFRLVYVDLRGGGRSTGDCADLTFDLLASDLEAIRRELGSDQAAILGHSILGMLALEYARRCPESVSHAILAGTPPTGDMAAVGAKSAEFFEQHASDERKQVLADNMAKLSEGASMAEMMYAQTPMRFYDPRTDQAPLFADAVSKPELLTHLMASLAPGWSADADADSLRVPVLIAHGRHDYTVPHGMWQGVVERMPTATLQLFERSGHQPFFEEPQAFAEALSGWVAQQG